MVLLRGSGRGEDRDPGPRRAGAAARPGPSAAGRPRFWFLGRAIGSPWVPGGGLLVPVPTKWLSDNRREQAGCGGVRRDVLERITRCNALSYGNASVSTGIARKPIHADLRAAVPAKAGVPSGPCQPGPQRPGRTFVSGGVYGWTDMTVFPVEAGTAARSAAKHPLLAAR